MGIDSWCTGWTCSPNVWRSGTLYALFSQLFCKKHYQKKLCHVKLCLKLSLKRDITVEYIGNKTKIIFIANVNTTLLEQCIECVIVFRDTEQTNPGPPSLLNFSRFVPLIFRWQSIPLACYHKKLLTPNWVRQLSPSVEIISVWLTLIKFFWAFKIVLTV